MCPKIINFIVNVSKNMWRNVHISLNCRSDITMWPEIKWQNDHISLNSRLNISNVSKNPVSNRSYFASGKGGHDVTEHFEEGGHHVTCDKLSTVKLGWISEAPIFLPWHQCFGCGSAWIRIRFVSWIRIPNVVRIQLLMKLAPKAKKINII